MRPDFSLVEQLRAARPLVHCIANIVTVQDCANIALAAGARPIMAQHPAEMAEIASAARACVLNTGTPNDDKFLACALAGQAARAAGRPLVLDPVGAPASAYRRQMLANLLEQVRPTLIRANPAEIQALLGSADTTAGVDSPDAAPAQQAARLGGQLARRYGCLVLVTGSADCLTDGSRCLYISGGSPMMARITGAGCMLSVLEGAFLALGQDTFSSAAAASAFWKACAHYAQAKAEAAGGGCGTFRTALFDAASLLTPAQVEEAVAFGTEPF